MCGCNAGTFSPKTFDIDVQDIHIKQFGPLPSLLHIYVPRKVYYQDQQPFIS